MKHWKADLLITSLYFSFAIALASLLSIPLPGLSIQTEDTEPEAVCYRITALGPYSKFVFYADKVEINEHGQAEIVDARGMRCWVNYDFIEAFPDGRILDAPEVTLDDEVDAALLKGVSE